MMLKNNKIETPFGSWNAEIKLHENNNIYYYNYFMGYWENREHKFYRFLSDKDLEQIEEHKQYYYSTLADIPF